jgi:hypothetical protein
MSDMSERFLETASALQDAVVKQRVEKAGRRQCDEPAFADWGGSRCYDCDDEMHEVRLMLGRVRCVACQTEAEARAGGR